MKPSELAVVKPAEMAVAPAEQPTPAQMLKLMVEKGVTSENVAAFEKLAELQWKFEERDAVRAFNADFVKLQAELPVIVASSIIPNRGKYERFEDVMRVVQPILTRNGFTVRFEQLNGENKIACVCHLMHSAGHSVANSYAVRVSGKADSETQADCKASTTAKRNALLQSLNIVIRQDCFQDEDNNPALEGHFITAEQAAELQHRVKMVNGNEGAFLKLAGLNALKPPYTLEHYQKIMSAKYAVLDEQLKKKEQSGK